MRLGTVGRVAAALLVLETLPALPWLVPGRPAVRARRGVDRGGGGRGWIRERIAKSRGEGGETEEVAQSGDRSGSN